MFEELETAKQPNLQSALEKLLTQPLARLLRNRRPWDLLHALNENVEKSTKIWNIQMRNELSAFISKIDLNRSPITLIRFVRIMTFLLFRPYNSVSANECEYAESFMFTSLRNELCVGGIYVRIFIKTTDTSDVYDPSIFCQDLVTFLYAYSTATSCISHLPPHSTIPATSESLFYNIS